LRPTVLVAPDKFKGSLTAQEVCAALASGLQSHAHPPHVRMLPVADGGEGTLNAAQAAGYKLLSIEVVGPTSQQRRAQIAHRDGTVIIEMAEICGLQHLPAGIPAPLDASSTGLGMAIRSALALTPRRIIVGLGGSASTDGGLGALTALGGRATTANGTPVPPGGLGLDALHHLDLSRIDPRLAGVELVLATDVDSVLYGPRGAAHVFAPQKGADDAVVTVLDQGLRHLHQVLVRVTGQAVAELPGSGAAGGVPAALVAGCGAMIRPGADLVLDLLGFDQALARCDLVITGEGSWDAQTAAGKAPHAVLARARRRGVPAVAVAGRFESAVHQGPESSVAASFSLTDLAGPNGNPMRDASRLLRNVGVQIAADLSRLTAKGETP
jgi:glycerate 2-kinase